MYERVRLCVLTVNIVGIVGDADRCRQSEYLSDQVVNGKQRAPAVLEVLIDASLGLVSESRPARYRRMVLRQSGLRNILRRRLRRVRWPAVFPCVRIPWCRSEWIVASLWADVCHKRSSIWAKSPGCNLFDPCHRVVADERR